MTPDVIEVEATASRKPYNSTVNLPGCRRPTRGVLVDRHSPQITLLIGHYEMHCTSVAAAEYPGWWRLQVGDEPTPLPLHLARCHVQALATYVHDFDWPQIAYEPAEDAAFPRQDGSWVTPIVNNGKVACLDFFSDLAFADSFPLTGHEYETLCYMDVEALRRRELRLRVMRETLAATA